MIDPITVTVKGAVNFRVAIDKLFEPDLILTIRRINWQGISEQRKAWEAVATAL